MRRQALLQGALGLPLVAGIGRAATADNDVLFSGLEGLDHALGGLAAGELACVTSPPHSGKTILLLDWAARICNRYRKNIVFYSANEPSFGIARKSVVKSRAPVFFAGGKGSLDGLDRNIGSSGAIIMVDAHSGDLEQAQTLAKWLKAKHPAGCAALISDGWCTTRKQPIEAKIVEGAIIFPAERWTPTFLRAEKMGEAAEFARLSGLPVVIGLQTASLVDDGALADSLRLSLQLLRSADRWLAMYRPEIYVDTEKRVAADRNVVCLAGKGPKWSNTRSARLRFDYRTREFETV